MIDNSIKNAKFREWYHKVGYSKYTVMRNAKRSNTLRKWLLEYKKQLKCNKCGESDIACLDFHHVDPSKKEIIISRAINNRWSVNRLKSEIEKCEVLCSNCHRKLHYKEYKDYDTELLEGDKPNYIGYHGNGIPKKSFDELHDYIICDFCHKLFPILKYRLKERIKRGTKHMYCSKSCYLKAMKSHT